MKLLCQTLHKKRLCNLFIIMFMGYVSITNYFLTDDENTAHEKLKAIDTIVEKLMELNFELLTLRGSHS